MSARRAGAPGRGPGSSALERPAAHVLRHVSAGVAFSVAAASLATIVYLDLLAADHERYVWLINGPAPFDQFGSGPFQLGLHVAFALAVSGFTLAGLALLLRRRFAVVVGLAPAP